MITINPSVIPTLRQSTKSKAPKPTTTLPFTEVPFMAPWMFTPAYLEVDYDTCSTVFLRSPLPQPDQVEIPSPLPPDWHQLVYVWYRQKAKNHMKARKDPNLAPPLIIEGQYVRLKNEIAKGRRKEVKAAITARAEARAEAREKWVADREKERTAAEAAANGAAP
ncbi:hypothetical protein BDK51DRAFT_49441 [Blyttiomyces helicus]|uniref:Uncharacterized protein n=1 Tax=Blyttiomyces helicus TaxID=388810 RepID=A0A4P9W1Z3_9FUNG|nr:hypothetical protein BDK51DRAFT_49441 [Blyttiomyces helicus]|eukprot:RKO84096.1 hypothetical protein BDK51DRAFT_49441 [Blyttiomyces helicus]